MGCDIHSYVEVFKDNKWQLVEDYFTMDDLDIRYFKKDKSTELFLNRNYGLFAFLAGVRNYSGIRPLDKLRGLPKDISTGCFDQHAKWRLDAHSPTYFYLKELLDFDYEQIMEDRRTTVQIAPNWWDGSHTCEPGKGKQITYRESLGEYYFKKLDEMKTLGSPDKVRLVMWFDN